MVKRVDRVGGREKICNLVRAGTLKTYLKERTTSEFNRRVKAKTPKGVKTREQNGKGDKKVQKTIFEPVHDCEEKSLIDRGP